MTENSSSNNLLILATAAIFVEGIITYINQFFVAGAFSWEMLLSICFGMVVAVAYNLDLPKYFGMHSSIPYIGPVLTGILISRGSNYLYDLVSSVTAIKF